ncbi:MAG TPA: VOC family protein [Gemmatimonadaceae bacterium]|nr:VOC family protein [Gemmatimonadaceae bacterium]
MHGRGDSAATISFSLGTVMPKKRATKVAAKSAAPGHIPTQGLYGWITHTELASDDPHATKAWCAAVLGWAFKPSVSSPNGDYHLFAYSDKGGGSIRQTHASETPGSMPVVHVADAQASFEKALSEGAQEIMPPTRVMEGVTVAVVRAPGGVPIGFSGP